MQFFITGTDTGVGKTYITHHWLKQATDQGLRTLGLKPVSSGCERGREGLRHHDAVLLQAASSIQLPYDQINPFAFEPPIAPHLAAQAQGVMLSVETLTRHLIPLLQQPTDLTLIEGVGGWATPLNAHERMSDLVASLHLPVILVVGMRLGCLNHALLTVDTLLANHCELAGWIANPIDPQMLSLPENIKTLERWIPAPRYSSAHQGFRPQ